jgi:hypothetical protein
MVIKDKGAKLAPDVPNFPGEVKISAEPATDTLT